MCMECRGKCEKYAAEARDWMDEDPRIAANYAARAERECQNAQRRLMPFSVRPVSQPGNRRA